MAHGTLNKKMDRFLNEAKKRGLDCGVKAKTAAIKTAFINQGVLKRKQLQYALKKLNYYKSTIDALYGPGTEKALTGYANAKGININNPERIFKSVLSQVSVPSSFKTAAVKETCSSVDLSLCSAAAICDQATSNRSGLKSWTRTSSLQVYVLIARKRRLNCDVK